LRKLNYFGYRVDKNKQFDFEWPTVKDLEAMPDDAKAFKVDTLLWCKNQRYKDNYIGCLQVSLVNG
jgi:hypothetical protein